MSGVGRMIVATERFAAKEATMISCPEALKWNKERSIVLNLLGVVGYLLMSVVVIVAVVFFGFVGAIFSLALKR